MLAESKVIAANNAAIIVVADICDLAAQWGREDALDGVSMRGSVWFVIASPQWEAYNEAYHRATAGDLMESGPPICPWTFSDADGVLPAWQRDDYVGA